MSLLLWFIENQRGNHFAGWPVRLSDDEDQEPGHDDNDNMTSSEEKDQILQHKTRYVKGESEKKYHKFSIWFLLNKKFKDNLCIFDNGIEFIHLDQYNLGHYPLSTGWDWSGMMSI